MVLEVELATGPIHFGLQTSPRSKPFLVAVSTDGEIYKLERKPTPKKGEEEKTEHADDDGREETFEDYHFRCSGCRNFIGLAGRVNHTKACVKISSTEQRKCVAQWLALKIKIAQISLTAEVWGEALGSADLTDVGSEAEYEDMAEFLKRLRKETRDWNDELVSKLKILEDLVRYVNQTKHQVAVAQKKLKCQKGWRQVDEEDQLVASIKSLDAERKSFEAKLKSKEENYLKKLKKDEEVFMAAHLKEFNALVEKLEERRREKGGETCDEDATQKRPQDRARMPAKKRPKLLLVGRVNEGASISQSGQATSQSDPDASKSSPTVNSSIPTAVHSDESSGSEPYVDEAELAKSSLAISAAAKKSYKKLFGPKSSPTDTVSKSTPSGKRRTRSSKVYSSSEEETINVAQPTGEQVPGTLSQLISFIYGFKSVWYIVICKDGDEVPSPVLIDPAKTLSVEAPVIIDGKAVEGVSVDCASGNYIYIYICFCSYF
jgi:hypothetical protein